MAAKKNRTAKKREEALLLSAPASKTSAKKYLPRPEVEVSPSKPVKKGADKPFGRIEPQTAPQSPFADGQPRVLAAVRTTRRTAFIERKKTTRQIQAFQEASYDVPRKNQEPSAGIENNKNQKTGSFFIQVAKASIQAKTASIKNSSVEIQGGLASPLVHAERRKPETPEHGLGDMAPDTIGNMIGEGLIPVLKGLYKARKDPLIPKTLGKTKDKISSLWPDGGKKTETKSEEKERKPVEPPLKITPDVQIAPDDETELHAETVSVFGDEVILPELEFHPPPAATRVTPAEKEPAKGESKIADAIGLAVGGPFYSAAKELAGLKDDPLVQKISGTFKNKDKSETNTEHTEAVHTETEIVQTTRVLSESVGKTGEGLINTDKLTVYADKAEFFPNLKTSTSGASLPPRDAKGRFVKVQPAKKSKSENEEDRRPVSAKREVLPSGRVLPPRDAKGRFTKVERAETPNPPADEKKSRAEDAQEEVKQEQTTKLLVQTIKTVTRSKPAEPTPAEKEPAKGESKIADAIGLAVGGPFYSAAKELYALKDDPLLQKAAGLFKGKKTKKRETVGETKTEAVRAEFESVETTTRAKQDPIPAEKERKTPEREKEAAPQSGKTSASGRRLPRRDAKGRFVKAVKTNASQREKSDEKDLISDISDNADNNRKKRRQRGRRRAGRRQGGRRGRGLIKRTGRTKAGKGISTGANLVKSAAGKVGGALSKSPLGAVGGKIGEVVGKANPLKLLGKAGGFLGRLAGKAALPLAVATTAFDAFKGWNNAAEITGKDEKDLTFWDKVKASGAKAAEGLSFGLVPAETFFDKQEAPEDAQKPVEATRTSFTRRTNAVMSGPGGQELAALMKTNLAAAPARSEGVRSLPSPLVQRGSSALGDAKTASVAQPPILANAALQGDKITLQKLDVIIGEIRGLRKKMAGSSNGASPINDPFLRETIAETERLFNTW